MSGADFVGPTQQIRVRIDSDWEVVATEAWEVSRGVTLSHGYAPQHWDVRCMRKCGAVVPPGPNLHAGIPSVLAEMARLARLP